MTVKELKEKLVELEAKGCSDYVVWVDIEYYRSSMPTGTVDGVDTSHGHQGVELSLKSL